MPARRGRPTQRTGPRSGGRARARLAWAALVGLAASAAVAPSATASATPAATAGRAPQPPAAKGLVAGGAALMLDRYYPNPTRYRSGYFLTGDNDANPSAPSLSVLWFADVGNGAFRQYNSTPFDQCHWDQLRWTNGVLRYEKTHDGCGTNNSEIDYSPGIVLLPQHWTMGTTWLRSGTAAAAYYSHDKLACTGVNTWSATALDTGPAPVFQNSQSIYWTAGADPSGCAAGYLTRWQDTLYLSDVAVLGTSTTDLALVREVGGNLDHFAATHQWDYDVRLAGWQQLP